MAYIRTFLGTAITLAIVFLGIGIYIEPLYGDLTRLANLSERDFGWRAEQPVVNILENSATEFPTVVVLGDSFSEGNVWQSVAADGTGHRFLTFDWNDFQQPSCLGSWLRSLRTAYPSTRLVVLETVERELLGRFSSSKPCQRTLALVPRHAHARETTAQPDVDRWTVTPDPFYVLRALYGTVRPFNAVTPIDEAVVAPLTRKDLFSNRRSDRLLYYRRDDAKAYWRTEKMNEVVDAFASLNQVAASQGIAFLVVVVPDKSTTYSAYLQHPQFSGPTLDAWNALAAHEVPQVMLRKIIADEASRGVDFYMPNDTHFSTTGYSFLGKTIAARITALDAAPKPVTR